MSCVRLSYMLAVLLLPVTVHAQQQQSSQSPMEQALRYKLGLEMEAGVQCNAALASGHQSTTSMQQALTKAHADIAELQAKLKTLEPPAPPDTPPDSR